MEDFKYRNLALIINNERHIVKSVTINGKGEAVVEFNDDFEPFIRDFDKEVDDDTFEVEVYRYGYPETTVHIIGNFKRFVTEYIRFCCL